MNINKWKFFDKGGSNLQLTPDPYIQLQFTSTTGGKNAEGFLVTDKTGQAKLAEITNGGYDYNDVLLSASYVYAFDASGYVPLSSAEASINTIDVSIFSPDPVNTKSISDVSLNLNKTFIYPSATFAAAIFLDPVSQGLVETEHLFIFENSSTGYIRPIDTVDSSLVFRMIGDETQIQFFTISENDSEITWAEELTFNSDVVAYNTPLAINIGFRSDVEGVFERIIRIYHQIGSELYPLADIAVSAEAIGEDERFRTLLSNFGLPDPKDFKDVFKETDINEDLLDWNVLNQKSKHMILEHDKIMPYVGTYKALINALKWLGYDDIYVREWFKNVKENKKISLIVPYNAADRTQTILKFNADQRKNLKKLNELSLNYCLTRETGEIDDWGTPETENCYSYNLKEVFIKLLSLKQWLEKNIIGVNCYITDITGEGIYFERIQNLVYATSNLHYDYRVKQSLSPITLDNGSELITGDASINLTLLELSKTKISDLPYRLIDMAEYVWNPLDPCTFLQTTDASFLADPCSYLPVGATFQYPFINLSDIMWKLSVEKDNAGVIGVGLVTKSLFIHENDIRFYETFDSSSQFFDVSTNLKITFEEGYLRYTSDVVDVWTDSIAYSIQPNYEININASTFKTLTYDASYAVISGSGLIYLKDASILSYDPSINPVYFTIDTSVIIHTDASTVIQSNLQEGYVLENYSTGDLLFFNDIVSFQPDTSSLLMYAVDDNYKVPLLSFKNYKCTDINGTITTFTDSYYLDIINGKIGMEAGEVAGNNPSDNLTMYINFHYDTSLIEQKITVNAVYESPRTKLFQIDPSVYYWADASGWTGASDSSNFMIYDNSIYKMNVNHIGKYNIEFYGWDSFNTLFYQPVKNVYPVWIKYPTIYSLVDNSTYMGYDVSKYMSEIAVDALVNDNLYPIYDRIIPLQGLTLGFDTNGDPYINVPSITYFQDVPEVNSINRIFNLTERVIDISDNIITVDDDYQKFYTDDDVKIVHFDKGKYSLVEEVSARIIDASGTNPTIITLDSSLSLNFVINSSTDIYILNDTYRITSDAVNLTTTSSLKITDGSIFRVGQLVTLIITDLSTNYNWGGSYRVTAVDSCTHTFDDLIPSQFLADAGKYRIQAKHAFSSYTNLTTVTDRAYEVNNNFRLYFKDSYYQEYFLDNTFIYINTLFDQQKASDQWYNDASDNLIHSNFYYYTKSINIDLSTLVILRSEYDNSTYLLNQKNIWTVYNFDTSTIEFKVYNESVPYIFNSSSRYLIEGESYDSYGNLIKQNDDMILKVNTTGYIPVSF